MTCCLQLKCSEIFPLQQLVPPHLAETVGVVGYDPFSNLAEVSLDQLKASSMFCGWKLWNERL